MPSRAIRVVAPALRDLSVLPIAVQGRIQSSYREIVTMQGAPRVVDPVLKVLKRFERHDMADRARRALDILVRFHEAHEGDLVHLIGADRHLGLGLAYLLGDIPHLILPTGVDPSDIHDYFPVPAGAAPRLETRTPANYPLQSRIAEVTAGPMGAAVNVDLALLRRGTPKSGRNAIPLFPESYCTAHGKGAAIPLLRYFLDRHGIRLRFDRLIPDFQIEYTLTALARLPSHFLSTPYLISLVLGVDRDKYDDGEAGLCVRHPEDRRLDYLGLLFHEIGHAVSEYYSVGGSLEERIRIVMAHRALSPKWGELAPNVVYALEWLDGRAARRQYQSGGLLIAEPLSEFLAEHAMMYAVDGPGLRAHIESLPHDGQRRAYEYVYNELRWRFFGGVEFT